jgi:O-antigen ligase
MDPDFGYKLFGSIAVGVALCILGVWCVYAWLGKMTKLNVFYRFILAFGIIIGVICLLGLITQALGL